jgi:hypothetical protein
MKNENKMVKATIKDCVFSDFFGMPENLLKLYRTLHPEDKYTTVDDLKYVTIENVLVNDLYNDLGFRVGDRQLILIEAQSTWSMNIIIRVLFYLADTYEKYVNENELDLYSSTKIDLPRPELFVLYTGNRKTRPDELSLIEEFFDGEYSPVEVRVKMLYGTDEDDVISQYVAFTKVYDNQRNMFGRSLKAIKNTIKICKERHIMKEYFEKREMEVIRMSTTLYDDETIMRNHDAQLRRDVTASVMATEREKGVRILIDTYKRLSGSKTDTAEAIQSEYGYTETDAKAAIMKYWDE